MELSLFLAKLLGLFFLVVGIICILRKNQFQKTAKELIASRSELAITGVFSLLFGLAIAISHSIWEWNWKGLVTLLGYLFILRGLIRIAFPAKAKEWIGAALEKGYGLICLIMLAIGVYLTYSGFAN